MTDSIPFTLDPVPPDLRRERVKRMRQQQAASMQRKRKDLESKGFVYAQFQLPSALIAKIDDLKRSRQFPTRYATVEYLLSKALADESTNEEGWP